MITLKWSKYPEVSISKYKIYKSILGFMATNASPSALSGKTLSLSVNGGPVQNILFMGTASIVDQINNVIVDAKAYNSMANTGYFYLRGNLRVGETASIEILSCDVLSLLGLSPKLIKENSDPFMIGQIDANQTAGSVEEFDDVDGSVYDYYAISSINNVGDESVKTLAKQPVDTSGMLCVVEGYVCDLQGSRIPDAEVVVTIQQAPKDINNAFISKEPITTLSGPDGKFSIPIIRGALVKIDINKVSFSRNVTIPDQSFCLLNNLLVDGTYQFAEDK